jgi:hypothetical protein
MYAGIILGKIFFTTKSMKDMKNQTSEFDFLYNQQFKYLAGSFSRDA